MQATCLVFYLDPLNGRGHESTWKKLLHTLRVRWDHISLVSSLLCPTGLLTESQCLLPEVSPPNTQMFYYLRMQGSFWSPKGRVSSESAGNKDWKQHLLTASCASKMPQLPK